MAKQYNVPYVKVRVARSPMNIHIKQVLAHEVFILSSIFDDVQMIGRVTDSKGRQMTRTVDAQEEYQRMLNLYGSNSETDKGRAEEVFGPPFSKGWTGALEVDLDELLGEEAPQPPAQDTQGADNSDKPEVLAQFVVAMRREDPDHDQKGWWTTGGKPEVSELKRRAREAGYDLKITAKDRDAAVGKANEASASGNTQHINADAVMARLDDLGVEYDPDDKPMDLVEQLYNATVSQIQALGGDVDPDSTLESLSTRLDALRQEQAEA